MSTPQNLTNRWLTGLCDFLRSPTTSFIAAFGLIVPHVYFMMFWTRHDPHDDSGYMLGILQGLANGGKLYEEVWSQHGPFYGEAWLLFFRRFGFPIDHNHAALGVALLWVFCAGCAWWCVRRMTNSTLWAFAGAIWCAWGLNKLGAELAHPKSLAAALCALTLVGWSLRHRTLGPVIAGAATAALVMTKINLGGFSLIAGALGCWNLCAPKRWMSLAAIAVSGLIPPLLIHKGWPPAQCAMLSLSILIPSLLVTQMLPQDDQRGTRESWLRVIWFAGSFLVGIACITTLARLSGISFHTLIDGVLIRPLGMRDVADAPPPVSLWEHAFLASSAVLALLWQIPSIRARTDFWRAALLLAVTADLCRDLMEDWLFSFTSPSLAWLALAAQEKDDDANHDRTKIWLSFAVLQASWQSLGVFPVFGAQTSLPRFLLRLVWIAASGMAFAGVRKPRLSGMNITRLAAPALVLAGLTLLASQTVSALRHRTPRSTAVVLPGANWFHWPASQHATLAAIAANLTNCPGPVLTFHGQDSLPIWAGKPVTGGFAAPHRLAMYLPQDIKLWLSRFEASPRWSVVTLDHGNSYGRGGESWQMVHDFVDNLSRPWLSVGRYEIRLAGSAAAPAPVEVIWKEGGQWWMKSSSPALQTATKVRLRADNHNICSFRWEPHSVDTLLQVPAEIAGTLEKNTDPEAGLWFCNNRWETLTVLPLAILEKK